MNNITYKQITQVELSTYGMITMQVDVKEIYEIHKVGNGMEGITYNFERKKVTPYLVDFMDGD